MAITARKQMGPTWFTPTSQEGDPNPARFKVRPLTGAESLEVFDHFDPVKRRIMARGIETALQRGLMDWENVSDDSGNTLGYSPSNLQFIPATDRAEVGNHIIDLAELSEEDEKNSE